MSRRRTPARQLVRLVEASPRPIYLLDEQRAIAFCNAACAAWAGIAAESLVGQLCHYDAAAGDSAPASIAARLCPPPEAFFGRFSSGQVAAVGAGGELVIRQAEFLLLSDPDTPGPLLVIVSEIDSQQPAGGAAAEAEASASQLHLELLRLRRQFAGRYGLERLFGPSAIASRVRAQVHLASMATVNVLIVGPAGSGKEHAAKAIHYRQAVDALRGLVPIACSALDPELLVSTLMSLCEKKSPGRVDEIGTLLLRDVDQLSLEIQPQVVRLLKTARELRVLSTARHSLAELVAQSQFSADLAALLSTLTIELPPLAGRIEDLPLLAQAFLEELNAAGGRQLSGFSPEALDLLAGYRWPGNLDELAEMVREAHVQAAGTEITPRDLPKRIHLAADAALWPRRPEEPIDLPHVLEGLETELIQRALAQAKGNKSRAAELLGLTRPRLYRRLVQLGMSGADDGLPEDAVEFEESE